MKRTTVGDHIFWTLVTWQVFQCKHGNLTFSRSWTCTVHATCGPTNGYTRDSLRVKLQTYSLQNHFFEKILHQCKRLFSLEAKKLSSNMYMYHVYLMALWHNFKNLIQLYTSLQQDRLKSVHSIPLRFVHLEGVSLRISSASYLDACASFAFFWKSANASEKNKSTHVGKVFGKFFARIPVHLEGRHAER